MTARAITMPSAAIRSAEQTHRRFVELLLIIWTTGFLALTVFGMSYYRLSKADRAFSPKHHLLGPSGTIGISLAFFGVFMLCGIFLYPLRKRWRWLQRQGDSKHWLDHHVIFGIIAPISIAFHAAFKFHGLAGLAFWLMVAVSLSGVIGRYLYAQVLREVGAAESSLTAFRVMLKNQTIISPEDLHRLFSSAPTANRVSKWSAFTALGYLALSDVTLQLRVARLRLKVLGFGTGFRSLGGLLSTRNARLEHVISLGCKEARLSRRLLFFSQAEQFFKLWHYIHKPFSYAFAVLALAHIAVAMVFGFI